LIFTLNSGKFFNQEEAIDLIVSLSATDANSEKKNGEVFKTPYTKQNYRVNGMSIGHLESLQLRINQTQSFQ
tara:strand:+ start:424 stop:639 length:216 start_codon:yes stop_codon:yes gene_type:complete